MRPKRQKMTGEGDLFRARLDQIIDMKHELVQLAGRLDWGWLDAESLTGCAIERAYVDKGYRGHDAENPRRVFISGQKRGVFGVIKRELHRRSAIEAVIGHPKTDSHLGRCHLKGRECDAANAIFSAIGHNLRLILVWLRALLRLILAARRALLSAPPLTQIGFLTGD